MRSVSRVAGVSFNTMAKLLIDAGVACAAFHDKTVRGITAKSVQADEIWSFNYAKQKNVKFAKAAPEGAGDVWTWTAIDADFEADRVLARWRSQPVHWHCVHGGFERLGLPTASSSPRTATRPI